MKIPLQCNQLEEAGVQTAAVLIHEKTLDVFNVRSAKGNTLLNSESGILAEDEFIRLCTREFMFFIFKAAHFTNDLLL